jgi:hypothetical protein
VAAASSPAAPGTPASAAAAQPAPVPAAQDAADRQAARVAVPERNTPCLATVRHCRSFRREVYLHVSEQLRGFVVLTPEAFALAAACQAAGRPVAACWWGHDPLHDGGAGRFEGAVLALDLADLPGGDGAQAS